MSAHSIECPMSEIYKIELTMTIESSTNAFNWLQISKYHVAQSRKYICSNVARVGWVSTSLNFPKSAEFVKHWKFQRSSLVVIYFYICAIDGTCNVLGTGINLVNFCFDPTTLICRYLEVRVHLRVSYHGDEGVRVPLLECPEGVNGARGAVQGQGGRETAPVQRAQHQRAQEPRAQHRPTRHGSRGVGDT